MWAIPPWRNMDVKRLIMLNWAGINPNIYINPASASEPDIDRENW
jgi:hypothetical protein